MSIEGIEIKADPIDKLYRLSDYTGDEIAMGKIFIKKAILGFVREKIDETVDRIFITLLKTAFMGNQQITIHFDVNTLGNDLLAALGAARNEKEAR